jgi:hypothetical protein
MKKDDAKSCQEWVLMLPDCARGCGLRCQTLSGIEIY